MTCGLCDPACLSACRHSYSQLNNKLKKVRNVGEVLYGNGERRLFKLSLETELERLIRFFPIVIDGAQVRKTTRRVNMFSAV